MRKLFWVLIIFVFYSTARAQIPPTPKFEVSRLEFVSYDLIRIISAIKNPFDRIPMRETLDKVLNDRITQDEPKAKKEDILGDLIDLLLNDPFWIKKDETIKASQNLVWYLLNSEHSQNLKLLAKFEFGLNKVFSDLTATLQIVLDGAPLDDERYERLKAITDLKELLHERRHQAAENMALSPYLIQSIQTGVQYCRVLFSNSSKAQL